MEVNKRNSNIELLRLVLMAFVVLLHFNNDRMGGAFVLVKELSIENKVLRLLEAFCNCAVNCFMIVSGYFLYNNNKIKFGKVFDILITVVFYRFFDFFCQIIFLHIDFSLEHLIACFLPANYFAIFYVICYLFSPWISKLLRDISNTDAKILLLILLIVFILIPTLLDIAMDLGIFKDPGYLSPISLVGNGGGYTIVQFFVMLILGMWFRKVEFNPNSLILIIIYFISSIIIFLFQGIINTYHYDFIFNVTAASCLFLLFKKMSLQKKGINFASKSCFAIFCIHTGSFANTIWKQYFITSEHFQYGILKCILYMFISTFGMFAFSLLISLFMRGLFGNIKNRIAKQFPIIEIINGNE